MSVDIRSLQTGIMDSVSTLIGVDLSEFGTAPNNKPAIIPARSGGPKPSFPYATVDFIRMDREGKSFRYDYFDSDTNEVVYEADYVFSYLVNIHSDNRESETIALKLRDKLLTYEGLTTIETETGFQLRGVEETAFSSAFMNTDYEEVSGVRVFIAVRGILRDASTGFIDTISTGGELYPEKIDEGTPINVDTTVP